MGSDLTAAGSTRRWRRRRAEVLAQSDVCWICGAPGADSVDHVVPRALGGDDSILLPAHRRCNSARGIGRPRRHPASRRVGPGA